MNLHWSVDTANHGPLLYGPWFDRLFLFGTVGIALVLGALAMISPAMFLAVVLVDVWLFASPHVIATYTRIGFDKAHVKKHWFLIFGLPPIVLVGVTMVALAYELGGLFTLYFIAQTYHVTRQSFGIARAYRRADPQATGPDRLSESLIYLFPLWGLMHRCTTAPEFFYSYPIYLPAVDAALADATGIVAVLAAAWWAYRQIRLALAGRLNARHSLFVASHLLVISVAYLWVTDITSGWLVVNIWHNLQYLLFVWLQNVRRDAQRPGAACERSIHGQDLERLTRPLRSAGKYLALCLVVGAAMYQALSVAGQQLVWLGLPTVFILHFTVNFHHYLVDGVIWKRPKPGA
ncbi:hypothetical protein [Polaromonas sp. JS666]|uniref:hypothetical protein n=1 Tax=Polaromonas sp. (strain JS666 / ATCC BAA-500) TaxID=296591 RepID=UPI0008840159|nr:hypothetical protein [Polaromonas sp. JS666]SDM99898.1 hypothetical protein SAMN05720382_10321 [Polaromonas sp. JS666]